MGTSKATPPAWMLNDGTGKTEVHGGPDGWKIVHPNGQVELLHCMGGVVENPVNAAGILSVSNPSAGDYAEGANIEFKVTWDEPVNIDVTAGIPRIAFSVGAVTAYAVLIGGSKTGAIRSTFRYVASTDLGEVTTVVTTVDLNLGTIVSGDDGVTAATLTFPADYVDASGAMVV